MHNYLDLSLIEINKLLKEKKKTLYNCLQEKLYFEWKKKNEFYIIVNRRKDRTVFDVAVIVSTKEK